MKHYGRLLKKHYCNLLSVTFDVACVMKCHVPLPLYYIIPRYKL